MRKALILYKDEEAGIITQHDDGTFLFQYNNQWLENESKPAISLTLPKKQEPYNSDHLFAFFYNMLPEGANKSILCKERKIDKNDYFSQLLACAEIDTIGAVKVVKIN